MGVNAAPPRRAPLMFRPEAAGRVGSYNRSMSADRNRLQSLVDALPDTEVQVAISFLAELGEQEIVDADTGTKLDLARTEPGDDIPLEEVRRRSDPRPRH